MNRPLLLHICCAPCGGGCIDHPFLAENSLTIAGLFYSNSNLNSREEYLRRLQYVMQLGEIFSIPVEADPYDHNAYLAAVSGLEKEPERGRRCQRCFEFNLARTAARAAADNMLFATTLTVSPLKSSALIFDIGSKYENFVPLDFKKRNGYLTGVNRAKEYGFYRQSYCGCEFSLPVTGK
ncbi:MAG: epoxyqueuosine reductase QueH [Lentisphaeria bacterium]|nr:epoxyqueuosine reductase QueH [Lentisphaeria bacterium]